ncbi:MAG TPA: hypothetical protein VGF45_18380, partial [Polyangia bacterium]
MARLHGRSFAGMSLVALALLNTSCPGPPCEPPTVATDPAETYRYAISSEEYDAGVWRPAEGNIAGSVYFPAAYGGVVRGPIYVSSNAARVADGGPFP